MNKTKLKYFDKEDILHVAISDEPESGSIEVSPSITAELNEKGELIGIEILNASTFIRDSILESVQAKMLQIANVQAAGHFLTAQTAKEHAKIQTPLSINKSKTELVFQWEELTEDQLSHIQVIDQAVTKLSRLTHSLLLLTKIVNRQFE